MLIILLYYFVLVAGHASAQEVRISIDGVTPTQAVISYTAPEGPCQVQVLEKQNHRLVIDFDENLFPGASWDNQRLDQTGRERRMVIAGRRATQLADDGVLYSRALQAATEHEVSVRCGEFSASSVFTTATPPLGNTYPEMPNFDPAGFGNWGWPTIDWTDPQTTYIDPQTGVLLKRATSPGDSGAIFPQKFAFALDPDQAWNSSAQAISADPEKWASVYSTSPLFLGIGDMNLDYNNAAGFGLYSLSVDDIEEQIWAAGSEKDPEDRAISYCLSIDSGQSCYTPSLTFTVPLGRPRKIDSAGDFPSPAFRHWTGGFPIPRHFTAPPSGQVDVINSVVHLYTFTPTSWFDLEWTPGTKIFIEGSGGVCPQQLCTIAEVQSSTQLLVRERLTLSTTRYRGANFGLLVRKVTSRGSIFATFSFRAAGSRMYTLPNTGASDLCSRNLISRPNESGYLCTIPATSGFSSLYFFIPATGEMRLLSNFIRPYSNHAEDGGGGVVPVFHNSFDSRDPLVFYAIVETGIGPYYRAIIRGKYTGNFSSKLRDYSTAAEDVITWTNLTPKSAGRDLVSQLAARRPDYRPAIFPYFQAAGVTGNKFVFTVSSGQDSPCLIGLTDLSTGDVTVRDSWSDSNGRWGACHSLQVTADGWLLANMNPSRYSSSDQALSGPWRLRVTAVYKNNQPSTDTSITPNLVEDCPSDLDSPWKTLGATGKQCIRIITDGEPCSATPAKTETTQFPCPQSAEASLLQPLAEGDILADLQTNLLSERFRIVRKRALNNRQLELTLQRRAFCTETLPDNWFAHANGFGLSASQSGGCYSAGWWLKADQPASPWLIENPILPSGHFDIGAGSTPGRLTSITGSGASYRVRFDQTTPGQFGQSLPIQINASPRFAGSSASIEQANEPYPSIRQWNASPADKRWMLDFTAYQSGLGLANESSLSLFENSLTLVPETASVYLISNPRSGLNRKILPVIAWAGRYWLHDISGPNSLITDEQTYSFCIADQADECRPGSTVNQAFVNVPRATIASPKPYCGANHYASNLPCLLTANAIGGSVLQWDISKNDPQGLGFRRLTMGLSGPGRQYTFSNARATPDGGWAMFPGFWLDGYRTDVLLAKLPPWPASDTIRRDDFQMVERTIITTENAPRVRLRFGYAENGAPESLYCTTRQESCVASGTPFSWLHEAPLGIACDGSCTVHIPSLSGRVLYYQVDRLSSTGSPVSSDPLIAVAIP